MQLSVGLQAAVAGALVDVAAAVHDCVQEDAGAIAVGRMVRVL